MQSPFYRVSLAILLGVAISTVASAQDTFDFIYYQAGGAPLRGTIVGLGNTEVRINIGTRGEQRVPVQEISRVTFSGEPAELRAARQHMSDGRFADALAKLNEIEEDSLTTEGMQRDYQFYEAAATAQLALTGNAQSTDAIRLMSSFISEVKDSGNHHYFEACELYGDLQVLTEKYDQAARVYAVLETGWPELALRSKTLQARVRQLNGDYEAAANLYGEVISSAPGGAGGDRQKSLALVGQAACLAEMGQEADAITQVEGVISSNTADQSNVELFARAYNAMGAAYRNQGKTQEALLAYLHVDLLFNGNPDAHAEALYNLAPLWNEVRMNDRSVRARELLRRRYSTSAWAKRE